jgi:hypothetical protein
MSLSPARRLHSFKQLAGKYWHLLVPQITGQEPIAIPNRTDSQGISGAPRHAAPPGCAGQLDN